MKYKLKCPFCGYEVCKELEGKVLKTFLCPNCKGFMIILVDKFNPNKEVENGRNKGIGKST